MIVVFDLELTAWPGSAERNWSAPGEHPEIIQIGAVRLDENLDEVAAVDLAVKPRLNPILSDYIKDLTGITQERIDGEGIDLGDALARLAALADGAHALCCNGGDAQWIDRNVTLAGIANPLAGALFVNVSPHFRRATGRGTHVVSSSLPEVFGFSDTGRAHDGLADARAIAEALRRTLPRKSPSTLIAILESP
ncbi:MAG: exonuclease domain-containing protein [Alphaproteobacteria bacterium]|nr:exonuclease domain-containing protein [Alphaproteobacteria bacterium]